MKFDLTASTCVVLPVVTVTNNVALPSSEFRTEFSKGSDIKALKAAIDYSNYIVLAFPVVNSVKSDSLNTVYRRGVVAKILLNSNPNPLLSRVKFDVIMRCDILGFEENEDFKLASVETMPSVVEDFSEATATLNVIKKTVNQNNPSTPEEQVLIQKINLLLNRDMDISELSDMIAFVIATKGADRYKYLFEVNTNKRLMELLVDLKKVRFYTELEQKIENDVRKNMNEAQKEYYLREKMRAIQEELGDKAKKDSDIEDLRKQIKEAHLPSNMEEKALYELERYQMIPANTPESGIIKTYLDFVLDLPWNNSSEDCDDISIAKKILDEDHYGLEKVKDRILEYLAVRSMTKKTPSTILCLVGPPGTGKTSLSKSVARALNKEFVKQSLGGVHDEAEIRGHRRTYIGALPGRILQSLAKAKTNNPVFLLDEIDKMSSDYKGDPTSAMLEVLDPEQNKYFSDNYLEEPFDLSKCFFIATANYLEDIPAPLRDRLEIVELSSYTEFEKLEIGKRHLLAKQLKLNGLDESKFTIDDDAILEIIQKYTREAGVRQLERLLAKIIRKGVKKILMEKLDNLHITKDNLEEYLGKAIFTDSSVIEKDLIGVVNGLAYTSYGGDTLQIEVSHYSGAGKVLLTGKLGDVMKESAETALSYVKANAETYHIDFDLFKNQDIHVHVPEGATPKDGPSAGVTMVTAIVSAFTNRPANHAVGMTGEITLRGRILPIGGLREKAIAAHRYGLKKILVPKENLRDLDEIPDSVKNELEIIPIETAAEAISYTLM